MMTPNLSKNALNQVLLWLLQTKDYWEKIGPMNDDLYGSFTHESQEIGNKAWLGGGKLMVNKKTWYAHLHKGNRGRGYGND